MHALVVDENAFASQQCAEPAVPEARAQGGQLLEPLAQSGFIRAQALSVALRRARQLEQPAGETFADRVMLHRITRWLTTSQIRRRFFSGASDDAARKRLRKLVEGGYLTVFQANRMSEAAFSLGREGKRALERNGGREVCLELRPPKQWEHFVGINDVRIAVELSGSVSYFFACWELPGIGWPHAIIPDAVFRLGDRTFALEFDRGSENIRFFVRSKIAAYRRGFDGLPLAALLVVTDRKARLDDLARAISWEQGRVLYSTIDRVSEHGIASPVFFERPCGPEIGLVENSLVRLSCRQESLGERSGL